jgi:hypothetical protein
MRRVALLIETSRTYGRDLLRGVKLYAHEHGPWSLFVEIRDLETMPPVWLPALQLRSTCWKCSAKRLASLRATTAAVSHPASDKSTSIIGLPLGSCRNGESGSVARSQATVETELRLLQVSPSRRRKSRDGRPSCPAPHRARFDLRARTHP